MNYNYPPLFRLVQHDVDELASQLPGGHEPLQRQGIKYDKTWTHKLGNTRIFDSIWQYGLIRRMECVCMDI